LLNVFTKGQRLLWDWPKLIPRFFCLLLVEDKLRPSYTVLKNIDGALSQITRLASSGYYFVFYNQLKATKDPALLDEKMIRLWQLDQPYWKREKRRRGHAPSIWYLRYNRHYLLMSTHGRANDGEAHPFFTEYESQLFDIRKYALYFCGYSIRYPRSKVTGKHRAFVRLDKPTFEQMRDMLCERAIRERYRPQEAIEAEFEKLPFQPYREVRNQMRRVLTEVNKRRTRYHGFDTARLSCISSRMRPVRLYEEPVSVGSPMVEERIEKRSR